MENISARKKFVVIDTETANKLLNMFAENGGKLQGFKQSMQSMYPLAGLDKKSQYEFLASLNKEQMQEFNKAMKYYSDVLK